MFNRDFYPSPEPLIVDVTYGYDFKGKNVLEPEAGKADIVKYLQSLGANVIACEINPDLREIVSKYCPVIASDFLTVASDQVSHLDYIVMNPPFSADEKHILHAWEIAPPGCIILAICNSNTLEKHYSFRERKRLRSIIDHHGSSRQSENAFSEAERETDVKISIISLTKPGTKAGQDEFTGFFLEEDQEEQADGIIQHNVIRELVNRYVEAIKIFDEQIESGIRMNEMIGGFYNEKISFRCNKNGSDIKRNEFRKELQYSAWMKVFSMMNLEKYTTKGLKKKINNFVENQKHIPFTMKNVYRMLEIVAGTTSSRMDEAMLEVFNKLTQHYHDNRYFVEGFKTNSHFLVNKKFIMPCICCYSTGKKVSLGSYIDAEWSNYSIISDFIKALCYISGTPYDSLRSLESRIDYPYIARHKTTKEFLKKVDGNNGRHIYECYKDQNHFEKEKWRIGYESEKKLNPDDYELFCEGEALYGKWFDWAFFRCKAFKKGTMHFEFKDQSLWEKFNQNIARILGYPLFEHKEQTAYQENTSGRSNLRKARKEKEKREAA